MELYRVIHAETSRPLKQKPYWWRTNNRLALLDLDDLCVKTGSKRTGKIFKMKSAAERHVNVMNRRFGAGTFVLEIITI